MTNTPILIPIKEHSERCPNKNRYLLPYTAKYLKDQQRLSSAWVISESDALLDLACSLGLNVFKETRVDGQDEKLSCWKFLQEHVNNKIILCPVTQPFRSAGLIAEIETVYEADHNQLDFITAITKVPDRQQFYVDEREHIFTFKTFSKNRKGATCQEVNMIDGSLYLIKASFLEKVVKSPDPTSTFWNGNFNCVLNSAPFIDIDTEDDLLKFEFLKAYF